MRALNLGMGLLMFLMLSSSQLFGREQYVSISCYVEDDPEQRVVLEDKLVKSKTTGQLHSTIYVYDPQKSKDAPKHTFTALLRYGGFEKTVIYSNVQPFELRIRGADRGISTYGYEYKSEWFLDEKLQDKLICRRAIKDHNKRASQRPTAFCFSGADPSKKFEVRQSLYGFEGEHFTKIYPKYGFEKLKEVSWKSDYEVSLARPWHESVTDSWLYRHTNGYKFRLRISYKYPTGTIEGLPFYRAKISKPYKPGVASPFEYRCFSDEVLGEAAHKKPKLMIETKGFEAWGAEKILEEAQTALGQEEISGFDLTGTHKKPKSLCLTFNGNKALQKYLKKLANPDATDFRLVWTCSI